MVRHILALSTIFLPVALFACGGSGGGNGGGGSGTGGGGTGGMSSSSSSSSSTSASSTTSTSSSTSASSSGSAGGACTNASDLDIIQTQEVAGIAGNCAKNNLGNDAATKQCIKDATTVDGGTGLSDGCIVCFDDTINCAINKCLTSCLADPNSDACTCCRIANCDSAFVACSGLPAQAPPAGGCP